MDSTDNEDGWFDNDDNIAVTDAVTRQPTNNLRKPLIWIGAIALIGVGGAALGAFDSPTPQQVEAPTGPTRTERVALDAARDANKTNALRRGLLARLDTLIEERAPSKPTPTGDQVDREANVVVDSAAAVPASAVIPSAVTEPSAVPVEIPTTYVVDPASVVVPATVVTPIPTQVEAVTPRATPRRVTRTRRTTRTPPAPPKPPATPTKAAVKAPVAPVPVAATAAVAPTKSDIASASSLVSAAYQHLKGGRTKKAVSTYRQAVALSPRNTKAQLGLGRALYESGQPGEAMRAFERVLARSPSNRDGLMWAGTTAQQLGQRSKAKKYYQRYLDKHPTSRKAKEVRRILKQL